MQNNSIKNEGSWIFISHSSKDIEKIRLIRNEFEKWGQNPLAFHLKCLNTDTEQNEKFLFDLIKKEIEARNWFVYCESESAQSSKYVQLEREYVEKVGKVQIWRLDLNKPIEEIMSEIKAICKRLQVFISCSMKDRNGFVRELIDELSKKDFSVWTNENVFQDSQLANSDNAISTIAKNGFFLSIITEENFKTQDIWKELEIAKQNSAIIIVLNFGNIELDEHFFENLKKNHYLYFNIPCVPRKEDMNIIVDLVLVSNKRISGYLKDDNIWHYIVGQAETRNIENTIQKKLNYENRFHPEKPIWVGNLGAIDDYCEIYKFPCCGKSVVMGDGEPSQYRYDGCKK